MRHCRSRFALPVLVIGVVSLNAANCCAQDYPTKPVRVLVGWAPGGGVDITGRTVGQKLLDVWNHQVIIDNRPGAAGNLAGDLAAKSSPDGYTLLLGSIGELAVNASLFANLPYDPIKDFSHIAMAVRVPNILAVHPSIPASNVKELIAISRSRPNGLANASPGNGSIGHLTGEMLKSLSGANFVHVPYKGAAPAIADLLGGQVQMAFSSMPAVLPHVKAGKLKALAVTSAVRTAAVPEIPAIAESGFPGFEAVGWYAFVGPAGIPRNTIVKINADINRIISDADVKAKLVVQGLEPSPMTPAELRTYMSNEITKWANVVRTSGSKVD